MARPTLRQLEFLAALADELHFGRAAEKCHVTQSALSVGVKELEAMLGVNLAERTKRSVTMTAIGLKLAERARGLLNGVDDLVETAAIDKEPLSGALRLGVIPTVGPFILPRLMSKARAQYGRLQILLREEPTSALLGLLGEGRLDAVLMAFPFKTGDTAQQMLFDDGYQFVCHADHPLARRKQLRREDLENLQLMLLERDHCLHRHALSAIKNGKLQPDVQFEATSLTTLVAMVAEGLGVTLLPTIAIDAGIAERYDIALVPIRGVCPRKIGLAWRKSSGRSDEFRLFGELVRSAASREIL